MRFDYMRVARLQRAGASNSLGAPLAHWYDRRIMMKILRPVPGAATATSTTLAAFAAHAVLAAVAALVALGALVLVACDAPQPSAQRAASPPPALPKVVVPDGPVDEAVRQQLAEAIREPDAFARARRLGELLPTLGADAVPTVKAILADPTLDIGGAAYDLLVRFWASQQPEAATRFAVEKATMIYRLSAVLSAMEAWAKVDPGGALGVLDVYMAEYSDVSDILPTGLVRGWYAAGDPPELAAFIEGLGMGFLRQRALSTYIRAKIQAEGVESVIRWAESFPAEDEVYKTAVYRQVASAIPLFDQEAGMRWCAAHCDGPYGKGMDSIIARRWILTDGAASLAWLATRPEGHDRDLGLRMSWAAWSRHDREAAMSWMTTKLANDPEVWQRPIYPVYARMLAAEDPEQAMELASEVPLEEERMIVLADVARTWYRIDSEAAEQWLAQSPLTESNRQKVREGRK